LQQIADFYVGVAIMGVPYFAAFAEKGVCFAEEEDGVGGLCFRENTGQVLFGLANVLADYSRKVDFVQV
jgi:hypothetical protein